MNSDAFRPPEMRPDELSDLDRALELAPALLGERYIGHNQAMLEGLEYYGFDSDVMKMSVALHDVADRLYSTDRPTAEHAEALIGQLYSGDIDDKPVILYGLFYAMSARKWEDQVAESWRGPALERLTELGSELSVQELHILERSITKQPYEFEVTELEVKQAFKKAKLFDLDVTNFKNTIDEDDIDGLVLKSIESLTLLDNPPANNPASIARDCMEIFNCYAPALSLCGFDQLAGDLRGKALEYLYDDGGEASINARQQRAEAEEFYPIIESRINDAIELALPSKVRAQIEYSRRIKSVGSNIEKLSGEKYVKVDRTPDGIGFRLIIQDDAAEQAGGIQSIGEAISHWLNDVDVEHQIESTESIDVLEQLAELLPDEADAISSELHDIGIFEPFHPIDTHPVEDYVTTPKDSGYQGYHMTFMYCEGDKEVPLEIQLFTQSMHRKNTYDGKASHLGYKLKTEFDEQALADLWKIHARANHIRNRPDQPSSRPGAWSELLRRLPELETPIHEIYSLISFDGAQVLAPRELAQLGFDPNMSDSAEKAFMSVNNLTRKQFNDCLKLLDTSLAENERIIEAVDLIEQKYDGHPPRHDGKSVLNGHLLPVALQAAILATVSGRRWESDDPEFMVNEIIKAMAHDSVEDTDWTVEDVRQIFDNNIAIFVEGISKPKKDITLTKSQRNAVYSRQLALHPDVLALKSADRENNHGSDNSRLINGQVKGGDGANIEDYHVETDEHLIPLFEQHLPVAYIRSLDITRKIYDHLKKQAI